MADTSAGTTSTGPDLPWYRASIDSHPFSLARLHKSEDSSAPTFHCTATFPWTLESMSFLWDGSVTDPEILSNWTAMVDRHSGTIAVGATGGLYIFPKLLAGKSFRLQLPDVSGIVSCVAWAISPDYPTEPLLVFTTSSVIFVVDVKSYNIVGRLRGHGGPITSIAVHPYHPYLFCTTSKDFTTRIYDLTLPPMQEPNNPHWPPSKHPSLAGPAHGLHMSEPEGDGMGRCVAVLVGGRSGGHKGAVFSAAFHPSAPLIATCGIDRAVKIWRVPPYKPEVLSREDKPLFSTVLIHKARVLSIAWLSDDVLISHSAPALMRRTNLDVYEENGTVAIWQWLGYNRYFPPGNFPTPKVMRGCASDYRDSESFKILSAYHLPLTTRNLAVYKSPKHDPVLLIPMGGVIRVFNLTHFQPRRPPPFPVDDDVVVLAKRMRLNDAGASRDATEATDGVEGGGAGDEEVRSDRDAPDQGAGDDVADEPDGRSGADGDGVAEDNGENEGDRNWVPLPPPPPLAELFDSVEGWDIGMVTKDGRPVECPDVTACELALGGRVLLGVGAKATLAVWRLAG